MIAFVLCFVLPPANGSSGCAKAERAAVLTNAAAFVIHACVNLLSNAEGFKRR
jgi:hypothetical protein